MTAGMKPKPHLAEGKYYFATVDESQLMNLANYLGGIVAIFREDEELTAVVSEDIKDDIAGLSDKGLKGPFALIRLGAQTDLYAVDILAKIIQALSKEKIAVNAFSAYYHDHLFVPYEKKEEALRILGKLG
jgi:hypothetical protein